MIEIFSFCRIVVLKSLRLRLLSFAYEGHLGMAKPNFGYALLISAFHWWKVQFGNAHSVCLFRQGIALLVLLSDLQNLDFYFIGLADKHSKYVVCKITVYYNSGCYLFFKMFVNAV